MVDFYNAHMFQQERLKREDGMIRVIDKFIPNGKPIVITSKFYSKYRDVGGEVVCCESKEDKQQKYVEYMKLVDRTMMDGPREKYLEPLLESQVYGWLPARILEQYDERDCKRFYHGRRK